MSSNLHKTYQLEFSVQKPAITRISLLVALTIAIAFILVTRPSIHGNDGVQNYAYLRSLMFDGDLDFTNEYDYFISKEADWFDKKQIPRDPTTNLPINLYGIGNSILWAPWVLLAHGAGMAAQANGYEIDLNGYSPLYAWAVGYGSCFYASLGLWMLYCALRRLRGELAATWSLLLIWLASPLFFYMYLHPSMSHANSFFLVCLLLVQYLSNPQKIGQWILLGLTAGFLAITRFQDGILLVAIAVGELWNWKNADIRNIQWIIRRFPLYVSGCFAFLFIIGFQLIAWKILQGSYLSGPRAYIDQGSFSLLSPDHTLHVMFSSNHGLFYWHPALLIAFTGLLLAQSHLWEKLISLAAFTGQIWVVSSWSIWWAGASFGHRMFISTLPFLAIGALFTVGRQGRLGFALKSVLVLLIVWNFGCIVQYGLNWIPRQKGVSYVTLAYNNFIRIPSVVMDRILR